MKVKTASLKIEQGWYSLQYGEKVKNPVATSECHGSLPYNHTVVIVPFFNDMLSSLKVIQDKKEKIVMKFNQELGKENS